MRHDTIKAGASRKSRSPSRPSSPRERPLPGKAAPRKGRSPERPLPGKAVSPCKTNWPRAPERIDADQARVLCCGGGAQGRRLWLTPQLGRSPGRAKTRPREPWACVQFHRQSSPYGAPGMAVVTLREVTDENRPALLALSVASAQERFVGTVARALRDAERSRKASPGIGRSMRMISRSDSSAGTSLRIHRESLGPGSCGSC
jgi:hypothetical protein